MNEHEHFEELCAAAVAGIASEEEFQELENHLQGCEECRQRLGDYVRVGAGILSAKNGSHRAPKGMTARFVARAVDEGIPLREPTRILPTWASRHPAVWAGAVAAGALIAVLVVGNLQRVASLRHREETNVAANAPAPVSSVGTIVNAARTSSDDSVRRLQAQLDSAIADKQRLARTVTDLSEKMKAASAQDGNLAAQVAALQMQLDQLRQQSSAKDSQIADLSGQLKQRETWNTDQIASVAQTQIQIHNLRDQLAERGDTIREQQELLAAGSQARNLIIARNLHIIDVHDNNGEGERQKAFGRIFYTEGKSIVFYAYDLNSAAKLRKQVAFYVWGGKLGDEHAVKNLGIFRSEDAGAGRWVLTIDDPHVLAQINTVFVTAESKKNVERPDGKPILYAFLGTQPNHP